MLTNYTLKQRITAASHDGDRKSIQSNQTDMKDRSWRNC